MMMRAISRKLWRDAWHYRGQMIAIAAVVVCGIALFVSLRSMHGYLRGSRDAYYSEARFPDVFASLKRAPAAVARDVARLDGVSAVEARVVQDVVLDVRGMEEPASGRLVSVPVPRRPALGDLTLTSGRWPSPDRPNEVLASQAFAAANALVVGDSIGAIVNGRWRWLRVTGTAVSPEYIYEIAAASIFPDNKRFGVLWMGYDALAAAYDLTGAFNDLGITLRPGAHAAAVIPELDRMLARYGGIGAYPRAEQLSDQFVTGEIEETQVTSIILPGVFIGVTAFLLHIVLSRLVSTQREQIATLKAFGYSRTSLGLHFLGIALVPIGIGSVVGSVAGLWFAERLALIYARFFQFPRVDFVADPEVVITAVAIGAAAGMAGALGAALRTAAMPPAEAMRPDAPARYRPGVLDRLGVHPSPTLAIIARNLERRPWKALLAVVGLALAGGLVITVLAMFDATDFMKRLQFHEIDRTDATVAFRAPTPVSTLSEMRRVSGVVGAEGFRAVPVRLVAGQRAYRTTLLGLPAGGQLRRVVDLERQVHVLPPAGLLLAEPLADTLQVHGGDLVRVEVLEGDRRVADVIVAGTVADLMGMSAYMALEAVAPLTGGTDAISGAYLRVDPHAAGAFYREAKRLPLVAGVGVRAAALEGFERTIEESFAISLSMTLGFACVIAFGIVYNSGRIALSERGRELASLRILGFTRREVDSMLLGEQAVLVAASLPCAFAIAWGLTWLIAIRFESTLFRLPVVIDGWSFVIGVGVVVVSAALSAVLIVRRVARLDLVAVLKTRE